MRSSLDAAVAALPRRDRILIVGCILALALLAWGYLVHVERQMASAAAHAAMGMAMDMPAESLLFLFGMWSVMMLGMMAGPAMPMFLLFAATHARRGASRLPTATLLFGLGYAGVWIAFSGAAAFAQWALHEAAMLTPAMATQSPRVGAAVLIAAGIYQLTPLKATCLVRCRSPLGFLMTAWRDGSFGALRMGLRFGSWCVGCCWALMAVLFVVGVMNLLWVAALMVLVLIEKTGPAGIAVSRGAGIIAIGAGILRLAGSL
ncbi:MAG TPA: DUF2182 domain-containing protein [Casimicrobiaceae bacterium]